MGSKLGIAIVTRKTRMQGLRERYATASMAAFALEQAQVHEQARRSPQAAPKPGRKARGLRRQQSDKEIDRGRQTVSDRFTPIINKAGMKIRPIGGQF